MENIICEYRAMLYPNTTLLNKLKRQREPKTTNS